VKTKELDILKTLEPDVQSIFEKHYQTKKPWYPHELLPWDNLSNKDNKPVIMDQETRKAIASSLYLNVLTEDNLPWYVLNTSKLFGNENKETVWGDWLRQWTAEEDNHSYSLRLLITLNNLMDPKKLEDARMHQMRNAIVPIQACASEGIIYGAMQELAARISYRNLATISEEINGYPILAKIASDENRHHIFYRDVAKKGFEYFPSEFVISLYNQVLGFQMPGTGIIDFKQHALRVNKANIFNFEMQHALINLHLTNEIWKINELSGLTPEAEEAREKIDKIYERLTKILNKQKQRKEEKNG